jgi:hypothetical protein
MIHRAPLLTLLAGFLLAGCAHGPGAVLRATAATAPVPLQAMFEELPAQGLRTGQCALALWSRQAQPLRFLMTLSDPAVARVRMGGKLLELARVAQTGQPVYGQFPDQRYEGDGLTLSVSFSTQSLAALTGGAVVSSAMVEYSDAQGWTAIVPAAGMIACQV